MLSHNGILGSLDAYADGSLPDSQRAEVAAHLRTCAECGESLRQIHRLDQVLNDLAPMPALPFARFWSKLGPRLPDHAKKRAPLFQPTRVAAAFALAVLASLVGVVALASDGTLPDSPLYAVKHFRQGVQLSLADAHTRPRLELLLGKQRIHEARVMVERKRDDLAIASLKDFSALMADAKPRLETATGSQSDSAELTSQIAQIKTDLIALSAANLEPDGSTPAEIDAVNAAVQDAQTSVTQVETEVDTTPGVVESPSPSPVNASPSAEASPSPEASPAATPRESPSVEPSAAAPTDAAPTDAAVTPAP
jgi:hypothetical protein